MRKIILCTAVLGVFAFASEFDELLAKCDKGDAQACFNVGEAYDLGDFDLPIDYVSAAKYYAKSCELKNAVGCYNLADMYERGEGVKKDAKKAMEFYKTACDNDHANACNNLGAIYGKESNKAKFLPLYTKSCDLGSIYGCGNLGDYYTQKGDKKKAKKYFKLSCENGEKDPAQVEFDADYNYWQESCELAK